MKEDKQVLVIRKSCITGKAVWIYSGPSFGAARIAYYRACKRETERVRNWEKYAIMRRQRITHIVDELLETIPFTVELTKEQQSTVRRLNALSKENVICDREFYEHVLEERKRREEDKVIRKRMLQRLS